MRSALALLVALSSSACGTDPAGGDDVGPDSAPHLAMTIDVLPMCQTYTWEAKVGQVVRKRVTNRIALVEGVDPTGSYSVELCYRSPFQPPTAPCPAGMACTGALGPPAPGPHCSKSYRASGFENGKMFFQCGSIVQEFDASGAETYHGESDPYVSIRVIVD